MKYRYPGAEHFKTDESDIFFGRSEDTSALYEQLISHKHVVLHSRSGLGKSSLVNAGLIPRLEYEGNIGHLVVRFNRSTHGAKYPIIHIVDELDKWPEMNNGNDLGLSKLESFKDTLWYKAKKIQLLKKYNWFLFVFDQFEEIFSYDSKMIDSFKESFSDLLFHYIPGEIEKYIDKKLEENENFFSKEQLAFFYDPLEIKALFIIRSDSLSLLDKITDRFPVLLKYLYELNPLNREQCERAINGPANIVDHDKKFKSPAFSFDKESVEHILKGLSINKEGNNDDIETNQLQWVLEHCEKKIIGAIDLTKFEKGIIIKKEDIGDIGDIIENYLNDILSETGKDKEPIFNILQEHFIIEIFRIPVPGKKIELLLKEKNIDKNSFDHLIKRHIIRVEPNHGGFSYELSHDTLIKPIKDAYKHRKEIEDYNKQIKQNIIWTVSLFLFVIFIFIFAYFISNHDIRQNDITGNLKYMSIYNQFESGIITSEDFERIDSLDLSNCEIASVPTWIDKFKNLRSINLLGNDFNNYKETFIYLETLPLLNDVKISVSSCDSIPAAWREKISSLDLSNKNFNYTSSTCLKDFKNLKELNLSNNFLLVFPNEIFQLGKLQILDLSHNSLEKIPKSIRNLNNLKILDLSYNQLYHDSINISDLENLTVLNLSSNKLKKFPDSIYNLPNLTKLSLFNNFLETISTSMCKFENIKYINLSYNVIKTIPTEFGKLNKITEIKLGSNKLLVFPIVLTNLTTLKYLDLSKNRFTNLPDEFGNLKNLISLNLSDDSIRSFPLQIFQVKGLKYLYLSNNYLEEIPGEIKHLDSLKKLDLSYNINLSINSALGNLTNLNELKISYTGVIKSLPPELEPLKNLRLLQISQNMLNEKQKDTLKKWLPNCNIRVLENEKDKDILFIKQYDVK